MASEDNVLWGTKIRLELVISDRLLTTLAAMRQQRTPLLTVAISGSHPFLVEQTNVRMMAVNKNVSSS